MEIFVGPAIHCTRDGKLVILDYAEISVSDGKIQSIQMERSKQFASNAKITHLKSNQFLMPGFIDAHIHPVQYPNLGIGYDKFLLEWLECHTFPQELKYSDNKYAEKIMDAVVKKTLTLGTTTACYFASLYSEASMILVKAITKYGQRAFVGKVNMNCCRDDTYFESTKDSIANTVDFIERVLSCGNSLVKPIITPRFALSCDMELMKNLGKIAHEKKLHIQTHISETTEEVKKVKEVYKGSQCYAAVYDDAGLLTDKTVLAHAIYLTDEDLKLIKERGCSVIHCPASNTYLKSGLCDVQRLKQWGVKVGLGTDISGGASASILESMRSALQVSNHISFQKTNYEPLTVEDVFYYATLGGAASLSIDNQVGNFEVGKQFDALIVDVDVPNGPIENLQTYTLREQLQRFVYCGDDRNISGVFVAGRKVK